ncbi:MAG: hypothetical protein R6T99_03450 [Bacteroidales bacterium]
MKRILIISPNFPPVNAADMHRVRQSLPYFREMGWDPSVIAVQPRFVEMGQDDMLLRTIPEGIGIHRVKAWDARWTRKFGMGNLGYRSWNNIRKKARELFRKSPFDLVYFSTTAFPVMTLGPLWKRTYKVPFIIDMQDPWRNDYYLSVPKDQRPPKFRIAYTMDKILEACTMKKADGILSVSPGYPKTLMERYPNISPDMCTVIPFGGAPADFDILEHTALENPLFDPENGHTNIVYIGRGGHDMQFALKTMFRAVKKGLEEQPALFGKIRMFFIGTSYARDGKGKKTIEPLAQEEGIGDHVVEITDRLPYFQAMKTLKDAGMVFVPGSTDAQYTASKLYPYILSKRPLIAIFDENSTVVDILERTRAGKCITFGKNTDPENASNQTYTELASMLAKLPFVPDTDWKEFEPYSAREMTRKQVEFFNLIIGSWEK